VAEGFAQDFKRFFLRGLAAGLPAFLTVALLALFFSKIQQYVGRYIDVAVQWMIVQLWCIFSHAPPAWRGSAWNWTAVKRFWDTYHFDWVGFLLAFVAIYIFGRFVASIIGRGLWRMIEQTFVRLPGIKQVYPAVKQVTDYLFSSRRAVEFSRVVVVEFPRRGCWALGLVTGPGMRTVRDAAGGDMLTVFVPSTPAPFTGYTIIVDRKEVLDLPISIDDAVRFAVSGGVIMPIDEQLSGAEIQQATHGVFPALQKPEGKENRA